MFDSDPSSNEGRSAVLVLEPEAAVARSIEELLGRHLPGTELAVTTRSRDYLSRLDQGPVDLVVCDGGDLGPEGVGALHAGRARHPNLAFVSLSDAPASAYDRHGLQALGVRAFVRRDDLGELPGAVRTALAPPPAPSAPSAALLARYQLLVTTVQELSLARDQRTVVDVIRRMARRMTGADGITFVVRDDDHCFYADEDAIGPLWKGQRFPMQTCVSGWAMAHRQPVVVTDIFEDPRVPVDLYRSTFVRSLAMVPIRSAEPIGAIGSYWAQARVPDPQEIHLLQALADTTAVAMENAASHRDLQARVRERTAELESFASAISHDLRAPIRHIAGYAGILLDSPEEHLGPEEKQRVERIQVAARTMREMVDGLLELSRAAVTEVRRVPVDLAATAREIAAECDRDAEHAVEFVAPAELTAPGDPVLLRVVVQNLLSNAWKFTRKVDRARVELGAETSGSGATRYFVRDNGAGFDPRRATSLFGVFQRLHRQEDFPGTGVGLATVARVVTKHDGRIWAESSPGEGATFWFTLQSEPESLSQLLDPDAPRDPRPR